MSDRYITSNQELEKIIDLSYKKGIVAIDTEFTRETTYYPVLSLVQIGVDGKTFAVDCLEPVDLSPIYKMIADEKVKKILHSSVQDLQIFYQKSNVFPKKIFDVQIMANFCGIGFNIGYANLVNRLIGVEIDKEMQRSDWQQRPLNSKQVEYALLDVAYLEEIYEKLNHGLHEKKREKWFIEEMQSFSNKAITNIGTNLFRNFSSQKKFGKKNAAQIFKIRSLILWREQLAQQYDKPRRTMIPDEMLEEMVMAGNFNLSLNKKIIEEAKKVLHECDVEKREFVFADIKHVMNEKQKGQHKMAKEMIVRIARDEGLREQFLITSDNLKDVILGNKKIDDLIVGWRYHLFGRKLQKLIS